MSIFILNSFTNTPFTGNPAAVCLVDKFLTDAQMQNIASEINYSETAFVDLNRKESNGKYSLRWFTPTSEIDLCGHATLATAQILNEFQIDLNPKIVFETRSGDLETQIVGSKIKMNFPSIIVEKSLGNTIIDSFVHSNTNHVYINQTWCLIELENEIDVINLQPKFDLLLSLEQKAFIVTAKSNRENIDFVSRCFAPKLGINEDPVTGSAHCVLAEFWGNKLHKKSMMGYQVSKRTGLVECELIG